MCESDTLWINLLYTASLVPRQSGGWELANYSQHDLLCTVVYVAFCHSCFIHLASCLQQMEKLTFISGCVLNHTLHVPMLTTTMSYRLVVALATVVYRKYYMHFLWRLECIWKYIHHCCIFLPRELSALQMFECTPQHWAQYTQLHRPNVDTGRSLILLASQVLFSFSSLVPSLHSQLFFACWNMRKKAGSGDWERG